MFYQTIMWVLGKTANHLRGHGKYLNALKASTGRLEYWKGNATHWSFTCKSSEDDVVGLSEINGFTPARGISHCHSQYPKFAQVGRGFSSQVGKGSKDVADAPEEGFSELESVLSSNNGEVEEHLASEDEFSELDAPDNSAEADADPYLSEAEIEKEEAHNASRLYQTVLSCKDHALPTSLEQWLADGNVLTREEVVITFLQLRKRRMFRRLLKVSDWLEVKRPFKMKERDYAARLDVIAKILGIFKAQKYLASIPLDMRGERVYRSLLLNCSLASNVEKTEEIFNKIKDEGFLLTAFDYNQLLWVYRRFPKKIPFVLKMMEDQGVKPNKSTYMILIDVKGRIGDIGGMEQVVKNMKSELIEPDSKFLALIARHYISAGLAEKAEVFIKELENDSLKDKQSVLKMLLPLYADLGKLTEVERIWTDLESFPNLCLDGYVAGVVAWGKLGQLEKAEITFEKLRNSGKKVSAKHYNALLDVYAGHHLLLKAEELVKQMSDNGCKIEPPTWDALVRLYVNAGELEKADSILSKACNQKQLRPMYTTMVTILGKYAEKGDIANAEKIFDRMRQVGYLARPGAFESLLQAYAKARAPAYGFRERMKADKLFPYGRLNNLLQKVDQFKKVTLEEIVD